MNKKQFNIIWLLASILGGCMGSQVQVSQRPTGLFAKEGAAIAGNARVPGGSTARQEMYVRQKDVTIAPVEKVNETGSLFNPTDERNFLFSSSGPVSVGRYVSINVVSKRLDKPAEKDNKPDSPADDANSDAIAAELLKALPDLAPAENSENSVLKRFDMKIAHRYENGDALVTMQRSSAVDGRANEIKMSARIPYDRLISGRQLTTDDLNDVKFNESQNGELANRYSSGWEDEYTLRMSGFDEANSQVALSLEDKRKRLEEAKDRVRQQIASMGKERQKVADERERVLTKSAKDQEKMTTMQSTIDEQKAKIKNQEEIISEMSPEEKAGDAKDGSDGA